jgi:hypothetical protein
MRENCTYSLSGGRWPARKRATSDPTGALPKALDITGIGLCSSWNEEDASDLSRFQR